jgi:tetratricopeptide (TPR) repeat protein
METGGPAKGPIVMDWDVLKEIEHKLVARPDDAILWSARGVLYFHENFEIAIESFSHSLSIDPFNSNAYYNRGRKYLSQDRFLQALADFILAVRLDNKDSWKWHFKGVALFSLKRYEEAVECFRESIKRHLKNGSNNTPPEVDWTWMAYIKMGRKDDAHEALNMVDADTPCEPGDMSYKKRVLLYKGATSP